MLVNSLVAIVVAAVLTGLSLAYTSGEISGELEFLRTFREILDVYEKTSPTVDWGIPIIPPPPVETTVLPEIRLASSS